MAVQVRVNQALIEFALIDMNVLVGRNIRICFASNSTELTIGRGSSQNLVQAVVKTWLGIKDCYGYIKNPKSFLNICANHCLKFSICKFALF